MYEAFLLEPEEDIPLENQFEEQRLGMNAYRNDLDVAPLPPVEDAYVHYTACGAVSTAYGNTEDTDCHGNPVVEVYIMRPLAFCFVDRQPARDEQVVLQITNSTKNAVIRRESDLLTPQELVQHKELVSSAILEELTIWSKHGCFRRQWRRDAGNVMDSRFVAKWKVLKAKTGGRTRIVRMRLPSEALKTSRQTGWRTTPPQHHDYHRG